jgi:hypothetical protein
MVRRLALLLTSLLTFLLTPVWADAVPRVGQPRGSTTTTRGAAMPLLQAPLSRPGVLAGDLTCMDGTPAAPALRCSVHPDEDRWACVGSDGVEIPVVQGVGTVFANTPYGRAMVITTAGQAPYIPTERAGEIITQDRWTGIAVYEPLPYDVPTSFYWDGTTGPLAAWVESTGANEKAVCNGAWWYSSGGSMRGTWNVQLCRSGSGIRTAGVNGSVVNRETSGTYVPNGSLRMGARSGCCPAGTVLVLVFFGCDISDDSFQRFTSQIFGTRASDGRIAATPYTGGKWCDGGWRVGDNAPCVSAAGLESRGAVLNYWTNSTTPEAWDLNGTPTVSGNTVTDNDAAAFQGVVSNTTPAQDGAWVSTCYVSAGTATSARMMTHSTGGTGGAVCDFTGLTAEPKRLTCAAAAIAGGTVVTGRIYVGNQSTVTGSIVVHQCQLEKSPFPGRRCDAGASPTTCPGDVASVPLASVPPGAEVCATIEPFACTGDGQVILDTRGADGEGIVLYLDDECHLALDATWPMPMTVSDAEPVPIGEPTEVCWRLQPGFQVRRDGQPLVTLSTAIFAHGETLWIGVDKDGGHQLEGRIRDVEVRR